MTEITYEAIMDYYRCPLLYNFKHELKLKRAESDSELYKTSMYKVLMFFYYSLLNGKVPSLDHIRNKWNRVWSADFKTIDELLFAPPTIGNNNSRGFTMSGITALEKFYYGEIKKKFTPIVVDTDVRVKIGKYYVLGTLELVRESKIERKKKIELVRFSSSNRSSDAFLLNHDFKLTFQSYAFRQLFEAKEDSLLLHNVRTDQINRTLRDEEEYNRLRAIINNVGDAISEKRFHPIVVPQCKNCTYKDVCDKFKF